MPGNAALDTAQFKFQYTSQSTPQLLSASNVSIDLSDINGFATELDAFNMIAQRLQLKLSEFIDERGGNNNVNSNYNNEAFPDVTVQYVEASSNNHFVITHAPTDHCYLYSIDDIANTLTYDLGFSNIYGYRVSDTFNGTLATLLFLKS